MPKISATDYQRMKNSYRHDVARHLAFLASKQEKITYGQLAEKFGGTARGWGDKLGGIAIRCSEHQLPLLPVIVVNAASGVPSVGAVLYQDLGLETEMDIRAEILRCFAYDWSATPLGN